jgi:hypothetical protein
LKYYAGICLQGLRQKHSHYSWHPERDFNPWALEYEAFLPPTALRSSLLDFLLRTDWTAASPAFLSGLFADDLWR